MYPNKHVKYKGVFCICATPRAAVIAKESTSSNQSESRIEQHCDIKTNSIIVIIIIHGLFVFFNTEWRQKRNTMMSVTCMTHRLVS